MSEIITDEEFDALIKNALHEAADCMEASNNLKEKIDTKIKPTQQVKMSE